ncbi:MAG: hypothetical protein AABW92_00100 [Nanoarchaeota archaeon]
MTNMTLSMPENISREMKQFSEVKWSEVARKAIIEKLETLKLAEKLASKSKLSMKDVQEFSNKIKSSSTKRFLV